MEPTGDDEPNPPDTANEAPEDGRQDKRHRVLKGATILRGPEQSETECVIRNMTPNGAMIEVPEGTPVPPTFLLYVAKDGVAYETERRWRTGNRIGVAFHGTRDKPSWHYG
ncbi:PilZ domain-containing protein [Pararhizobium mangrovi]|uniref:PilZ domain-containing protein n=1 Tax=Pararhizobium mangrovi TaxID=2590452 RepID=A0A506U1B5_9HYPH|nr:PilZ domain-containing protein [Pararhizobium mangrovi]